MRSSSAAAATSSRTVMGRRRTRRSGIPTRTATSSSWSSSQRTIERGLPLIGMCRGSQVVNVAMGGTLVQDVSLRPEWEQHPTDRGWHRWKEVERASLDDEPDMPDHPRHPMAVAPGSRLHDALGVDEIEVNSFHHQAIGTLAPGLRGNRCRAGRCHRGDRARFPGRLRARRAVRVAGGMAHRRTLPRVSSASSWRPQPTSASQMIDRKLTI